MKQGLKISVPLAFALIVLSSGNLAAQFGEGFPFGDGGGDVVMPCGAECFPAAMEAAMACKADGGDLLSCAKVFMDTLNACRAEAGCETPQLPTICGEECLTAARAAIKACHEAGGDMAACFTEVKTQLKDCLAAAGCELPTPPPVTPPCGISCIKDAVIAAKDCLQNGGKFLDCAVVFRDTLEACRAAAGCGEGEEPPPEEDAEVLALLVEETFIRGDVNEDKTVDMSDPLAILGFLFRGTTTPACKDAADANDDGAVDITDPIRILFSLFLGAPSLAAPYPDEGFDPTEDPVVCGMPGN